MPVQARFKKSLIGQSLSQLDVLVSIESETNMSDQELGLHVDALDMSDQELGLHFDTLGLHLTARCEAW